MSMRAGHDWSKIMMSDDLVKNGRRTVEVQNKFVNSEQSKDN
jgi:hypothetical protein